MEDMKLKLPPTRVNLDEVRRKYHAAAVTQEKQNGKV